MVVVTAMYPLSTIDKDSLPVSFELTLNALTELMQLMEGTWVTEGGGGAGGGKGVSKDWFEGL